MLLFFLCLLIFIVISSVSYYTIFHLGKIILDLWKSYGVPFVLTKDKTIDMLIEKLDMKEGELFVDLGCGNGAVLEKVVKKFPYIKAIGYEIDTSINLENKTNGYEIIQGDFFDYDLSQADVIYCYLMPHLMSKVRNKISYECKNGTIFYSNAFPVLKIDSIEIIGNIKEKRQEKIYIYTVNK